MKSMPLPRRDLPSFVEVAQPLPSAHIDECRAEVQRRLFDFGLRERVKSGHRIAITAGSRGFGGFLPILSGIAAAVRDCGAEPFLIPAMGSHGGATPAGQTEILRRLGVTDEIAPICATMDTLTLRKAPNGAVAHLDRYASEADGIIVLGRTKTHPESSEGLASGLLKMVTIGLGKQKGAAEAHSHGLWDSVRQVPRIVMSKAKIVCGVAVVENGLRQPLEIEIVPPNYEAFLESDQRLLVLARQHLAKIPFDHLDVLILDEIGKTVSGAGMDPNVIGRWRVTREGPRNPDYRRIVVLSLTSASLGNGLGIGLADFTTRRFQQAYDPDVSYINLLTASEPGGNTGEGPMPIALPTDRQAIEVALYSSLAGPEPRLCRAHNTGDLAKLWISEALMPEAESKGLRVIGELQPLPFTPTGDLLPGRFTPLES